MKIWVAWNPTAGSNQKYYHHVKDVIMAGSGTLGYEYKCGRHSFKVVTATATNKMPDNIRRKLKVCPRCHTVTQREKERNNGLRK